MDFDDVTLENNNFSLNSNQRRATICSNNVLKPPNTGFKSFVSSRRGSALFRIDKDKKSKSNGDITSVALSESPLLKQVRLSTSFKPTSPILFDQLETISTDTISANLSDDKKRKMAYSLIQSTSISSPNQTLTMNIEKHSPLELNKSINNEAEENSYHGFSIIKNRLSSASKASLPCSPIAFSGEKLKPTTHSSVVIMRGRSSSYSNAQMMDCSRLINNYNNNTTPHSPQKFHTPLSYPENNDKYRIEISNLKDLIYNKDIEINKLHKLLEENELKRNETENNQKMAYEEISSCNFMSSLLDQKIEELEQQLSSERMNHNETMNQKSRKHKNMIKKMNQDRADYETRADSMIQQMNEQMLELQNMAMGRIETLEKELMSQRHAHEQLQSECIHLRTTTANAVASAAKQKDLMKKLQITSPLNTNRGYTNGYTGLSHQKDFNNNMNNCNRSSNGSSSTRTVNRDENDDDASDNDTIIDENHQMNSPTVQENKHPNNINNMVYTLSPQSNNSKNINHDLLSINTDVIIDSNVWNSYL